MPMKKETILKKAISKAVKNGWNWKGIQGRNWEIRKAEDRGVMLFWKDGFTRYHFPIGSIIFNHSFAKCFFGEDEIFFRNRAMVFVKDCGGASYTPRVNEQQPYPAWQYHLQQLALAKDRLKYLEKFL